MRYAFLPPLIMLTLAALLAGCSDSEAPAQSGGARPAPEAGYITIEPEAFTLVNELPGRTSPYQVAEVRPQVTGILEKRLFNEGNTVEAGDALYQIDDKLYQASLASAKADLASTQATLKTAQLKSDRYEKLIKSGAVSQQDLDEVRSSLSENQARVAAGKAAVQTATINLEYTTIKAPISGRIGRSAVTAGALVTANQATSLVTIRQLDPIYVDLTQSYADMQALRNSMEQGQLETLGEDKAAVTLVDENGKTYDQKGTLQFSEFSVDENTGSVTLRALFPNPNGELLPGMFVRARLPQGEQQQAILVPQRGISRDPSGQATAMVIGEGDKVEKRKVVTDKAVGNRWLIRDGLAKGDRLIVDGLQKIGPGAQVKPVDVNAQKTGTDSSAPADAGQG